MTVQAIKNYDRAKARRADPRIALLKELADPIRLRVVDRLGDAGPATVSRLAAELEVPLPQLSNHLRRLRQAGLVCAERSGRQVVYALADPGLELLTPLLDSITGRVLAGESRVRRTCRRAPVTGTWADGSGLISTARCCAAGRWSRALTGWCNWGRPPRRR